jgi:DNA-binding protein YbaB
MTSNSFGPGADSFDVLAKQKQRFEALRARAEGAQAQLAENHSTVSSPDGAVTIAVNAGGQLEQLRLGAKADGKTMLQLTDTIMKTYRRACAEAAARTIDIMADLSGENSMTVTTLKANLPAEVAGEVEEIRREEGRNV